MPQYIIPLQSGEGLFGEGRQHVRFGVRLRERNLFSRHGQEPLVHDFWQFSHLSNFCLQVLLTAL